MNGTSRSTAPLLRAAAEVAVLTPEEMRAWDQGAIEQLGVPERVLMEAAGRAAAAVVQHHYPRGRVVAAVGRGNNGGDAIVLLRTLRAWGRDVCAVVQAGAELPRELLHGWELPVETDAAAAFAGAGVLVDGLLGTGARGAPREATAALIEAMNAAARPVVALDGPSGVDLDTGQVWGAAVRAVLTVTFGALKRGHVLYPGRARAGRVVLVEIGLPPLTADAALLTPAWAAARLPRIAPNAHKGTLGTVVVVAGHEGMAGAAVLAARGALRAGAGMVRLISAAANRLVLQTKVLEALFTDRAASEVEAALEKAAAVVVGPALGADAEGERLLRLVLSHGSAPLLLDADALTLLARDPALLEAARGRSVLLTPHPGEMARLTGLSVAEIVAKPFEHARALAERLGVSVLLKGAPALVATPGEATRVSVMGHSGIATGGMGDTLAGVAGTMLAMGCSAHDAAGLALVYASRAAEVAGRGRGLLPLDVSEALPAALEEAGDELPPLPPGVLLDLPAPR
jgi:NAD(P)H-hydrate epimerase